MKISLVSDQISELQTDCVLVGLFENDMENNEKTTEKKLNKEFKIIRLK